MPFQKGIRLQGQGGKREKAGRPKLAELNAKEARLIVWQRELTKWDAKHAKRFCEQAMEDNTVLLSARKAIIPDAKQEVEITGGLKIIKVNAFDPDGDAK